MVVGHPALLRRLLANLMENSLRHTPPGGTVLVTGGKHGDAVVLSVEDTGPGIAAAERRKVFNRFYRSDQSRDGATGGTGLELSISRKIVEFHKGTIQITDRDDGGAVLQVVLPLRPSAGKQGPGTGTGDEAR